MIEADADQIKYELFISLSGNLWNHWSEEWAVITDVVSAHSAPFLSSIDKECSIHRERYQR